MKLSNSIRQALLTLLNQNIIVASWGLSNICIKESYICFFVEGFKYAGSLLSYIHLNEFIEKTTNYENRIDGLLDI